MLAPEKIYEVFFGYIELFEHLFGPKEDEEWNEFISDVKEEVSFKYLEVCQKQSPDST